MSSFIKMVASAALFAFAGIAGADPAFDSELLAIQHAWDVASYETPRDAQESAFAQLASRAETFAQANPTRAEALVWEGIVESSYAGAKGGLGALGLAKKARSSLEAAMKIDPAVLDGSAYTSLGTLYFKVPGFPLGFGDRDKAKDLLRKALTYNPNGIDPNYFYGEYLYEQGHYADAMQYLDRAAHAPARPGREVADEGRRQEVSALTEKVRAKLG